MHVKKEVISLKCKACGAKTEVDMRHKLNSYIVKNPPPKEKKIGKTDKVGSLKESKDSKKKKKSKKESHHDDENGCKENGAESSSKELPSSKHEPEHDHHEEEVEDDEEDDTEWMTDVSAAAVRARAEEQLSDATRDMVAIGNLEAEAEARKRKEAKAKAEEEERKKKEQEESIPEAENEAEEEEDDDDEEEEDDEQEIIQKLRDLIPVKPAATIVKALNNLEVEGGVVQKMRLLYESAFGEIACG